MLILGIHLTQIGDNSVLLEPGDSLDPGNPDAYLIPLLDFLQQKSTRHLIYDMSNVAIIDSLYYSWLVALARLCAISGIDMIVTNMRPHTVYALALALTADPPFRCALDVDSARRLIQVVLPDSSGSATDLPATPGMDGVSGERDS